jgi:hypothetical protein
VLRRLTLAGLAGLSALALSAGTASAVAKSSKPTGEKTAHRLAPGSLTPAPPSPAQPKVVPLRSEHPGALADEKRQAAQEHGKAPAAQPLSPTSPAANWDGLQWSSNTVFALTPPDTTGAIGPSSIDPTVNSPYYTEFVNGVISPYDRTTLAPTGSAQSGAFTGPTGRDVFDIQVEWSQEAKRWFYAAISNDGDNAANKNFLLFGWSKTNNATGSLASSDWCHYAIGTGTRIDDYPKLGHSANSITIGSNVFTGNTFNGARIWAIPKPTNGSGTCPTSFGIPFFGYNGNAGSGLKTAAGDNAFTPVPANTVNPTGGNGYVVAADDPTNHGGTGSYITVWHVAGTPTSPTLVQDGDISVANFSVPAPVPQPGTTKTIDSSDTRLTQAVEEPDPDASSHETIWTQHTIDGSGTPSVVRWYELDPSLCSPNPPTNPATCPAGAKRQQGDVVGTAPSTDFTFNGAISPTTAGNSAVINFNEGSSTALVTLRAQSRMSATSLGSMANEGTLVASAAIDRDFSCSPCRWGDYAAASPDPSNSTLVWGSNQYNGPIGAPPNRLGWKTRNFAITP